jgi:hypothetical protein
MCLQKRNRGGVVFLEARGHKPGIRAVLHVGRLAFLPLARGLYSFFGKWVGIPTRHRWNEGTTRPELDRGVLCAPAQGDAGEKETWELKSIELVL